MTVIERMFHYNITVSDMGRAIAFYTQLGFVLEEEVFPSGKDIAPHLGVEVARLRAAILRLPDDPAGPVLDLVEYVDPPSAGAPYDGLDHLGIARISFEVDDFESALGRLRELDVAFFGPPVTYPGPYGAMLKTVMFRDPDGTGLQIIGAA